MKRAPTSFETTVRAFRDLTAAPADGAATRTRVLARAERNAAQWVSLPRTSLAVAAALVALSSASAAFTIGAARRWRAPTAVALATGSTPAAKVAFGGRPLRRIPSAGEESGASPERASTETEADAEARAYGRAHRTHFVDDAPARALGAWDDYLTAFPRGVFAPEARYNRALCLVRLGRLGEAARALRAFERESPAGYRRDDARLLLDWVHERLESDRLARATSTRR
jgi:TolA-binding protein